MIISESGSKSTKTHMVKEYKDIEFSNLQKGDSIVVGSDPPQLLSYMDTIESELHLFGGVETYLEDFGSLRMRHSEFNVCMIELAGGLVLSSKGSVYGRGVDVIQRSTSHYKKLLEQASLFGDLFRESHYAELVRQFVESPGRHIYESSDRLHKYVCVPLKKEGNFLAVGIENAIDTDNITWASKTAVYVINENVGVYNLHLTFEDALYFLEDKSIIVASQKEYLLHVNEAIMQISNEPHEMKSTMKKIKDLGISTKGMNGFFKPIYLNAKFNLKAFIGNFVYKPHVIFTIDGKVIEECDIAQSEVRKAKAIFNFEERNKCGISPYDGKLYTYGKLDETDSTFQYTVHGSKYRNDCYVKIDNYFVPSVLSSDADMIQKINSVIDLAEKLQQ